MVVASTTLVVVVMLAVGEGCSDVANTIKKFGSSIC